MRGLAVLLLALCLSGCAALSSLFGGGTAAPDDLIERWNTANADAAQLLERIEARHAVHVADAADQAARDRVAEAYRPVYSAWRVERMAVMTARAAIDAEQLEAAEAALRVAGDAHAVTVALFPPRWDR